MKEYYRKWLLYSVVIIMMMGSFLSFAPVLKSSAVEGEPSLLISEIVVKSDGAGQAYEYVEIYNDTSRDIDLEDYELQYFTNVDGNPANRWGISNKTIKARDTLVLWLKKYNNPDVPLWDFNSNYNVLLSRDQVFEVALTTSGQGLHDSSLRKVAIAGPDGVPFSTALINDGGADGITNQSVIYQKSGSSEMTKIRNGETATPGKLKSGQLPGPVVPAGVSVIPMDQAVLLDWEPSEGALEYKIYHSTSTEPVTVSEANSFTMDDLTNDQVYSFRVSAVDSEANESPASTEIKATPQEVVDTEAPAKPLGLNATAGVDHIKLKWRGNSETDLAGYRVFINGTVYDTVASEQKSINVYPLELGREYTFEITAFDQVGNESEKSDPLVSGPSENAPIPDLLITELIPNTDNYGGYDAFEYLEIHNNSEEPIDLEGYRIQSYNWDVEITESLIIDPWETHLFWTRTGAIQPISLEAFNYNYFMSYESKYIADDGIHILDNIGGLVNGGQTVTVLDPEGLEVVRANYTGEDVSLKGAITFSYPQDGTLTMETLGGHQTPTPGWISADQAPARPVQDDVSPEVPANINLAAGNGEATLTWEENSESDMYRYHIYKDGALEFSVDPSVLEFTLSSLIGNRDYAIEITAEDTSGNESEKSIPVIVTPAHQFITQEERSSHHKDPKYQGLWDISEDGPVIAGLVQDLVPQGLTYYKKKDWLLTASYLDDGRPGTLTVTNATSGELVKSVLLYNTDGTPYTGHAGGVTVSRDHVWISSEEYLFQMKISDLVSAENNGEIQFINQIPVPVHAAYTVYDEGILWVGEFYEANAYPTDPAHHIENREGEMHYAWMVGYNLQRNNDNLSDEHWNSDPDQIATPDYVLSTTGKVQGTIVQKQANNGITLSTSYGRGNDSVLYRYEYPLKEEPHDSVEVNGKEVPLWFLDGATSKPRQSIEAIPMPEGIVEIQKELYVVFESGANKYRYTTTYPMDRLLKIDMKKLMKDDKASD
ncbi:lamin tail domain-containing protein [Alkalihalobacillus sp. TS-13]|uniref:lamin tail domain-containing protein n=1 Tax=Alkalihalobacillus sp. TS-13 TaxID=2842455 RepID=UPI001C88CB4F|nr:lamin tail domain-containing protein [Alkalihalobacillus sp. TS-13]